MTTENTTKYLRLNMAQTQKVITWMQKNPDTVARFGYKELAKKVSEALGFEVGKTTISTVAIEVLGIRRRDNYKPSKVTITTGNNLQVLSNAIANLYTKLGERMPDDFVALLQKSNTKKVEETK